MNGMFEEKSKETGAPLIEIVEDAKTETSPELRRPRVVNTRNYAEDTSVINLSTMPEKIRVLIMPLGDEERFKELIEGGEDRKGYLFRGVTSSRLRDLFQHNTRDIAKVSFNHVEEREDVFQTSYGLDLKEKIYTATERLNKTYDK